MSLYEISIINILNLIRNGVFSLEQLQQQYQLPQNLLQSISEYVTLDPESSFIISVSNKHFKLAEYFYSIYSSTKKDYEITNLLMGAIETQIDIHNLNGIEYILSKVDSIKYTQTFGRHKAFLSLVDLGLSVSSRLGNISLVNFFIKKGSKNMNRGLDGATRGNHINLVEFFIENGAVAYDDTIKIAIESGNEQILNMLLKVPGPEGLGIIPLMAALNNGFPQFIDILMPAQHIQSETVKLGPRLLLLLKNTSLMTKSGINYDNLFPLLQQGYGKKNLIYNLFKLYTAQKDVYFDPLLVSILGEPLYTNPSYIRNRRLGPVNPKDPTRRDYFILMQVEKYKEELELFTDIPPELVNYFSTSDVIAQLVKEDEIMQALYLPYGPFYKTAS